MSANKHRPHVLVLPEDRANEQLANGFRYELSPFEQVFDVGRPEGGWLFVKEQFALVHVNLMHRYLARYMVLLIDFDDSEDRMSVMKSAIPDTLAERVFVIGVRPEPEDLRKANLGSLGYWKQSCQGMPRERVHHLGP